ncbi:hypothetical protein HDU93_000408 [Gonapodya sp. JEL0774]|nr:hypothetical protein HDU93_000408 [Gonapodya sp. JEL0774]
MVLYTRLEFDWGAFELGMFISLLAVSEVFALVGFLPWAVGWGKRVLGSAHEVWFIRIAFLGDVVIYILFALATQGWHIVVASVILAPLCHALGTPATRGLLSTLAGADQQARVFSALQVVEGVGGILAQLTFPIFYGHLVTLRRERLVMFAASFVLLAAFGVTMMLSVGEVERRKREEEEKEEGEVNGSGNGNGNGIVGGGVDVTAVVVEEVGGGVGVGGVGVGGTQV